MYKKFFFCMDDIRLSSGSQVIYAWNVFHQVGDSSTAALLGRQLFIFKLPLLMNTFHQVAKSDKFSLYNHLP